MEGHARIDGSRRGKTCGTRRGEKGLNSIASYGAIMMAQLDTGQLSSHPPVFVFPRCTSAWSDTVNLAKL